ncbi:MAG: hypothetical protein Q7S16_02825 [bacterium]|nr:hypothetical protein [bacterium]
MADTSASLRRQQAHTRSPTRQSCYGDGARIVTADDPTAVGSSQLQKNIPDATSSW